MKPQQAGHRSHIKAAVRSGTQAKDIVYGLVVQVAHGDDAVFVCPQVQPYQAVSAASGIEDRVSGRFHGIKALDHPALEIEVIFLVHLNPVSGELEFMDTPARAGDIEGILVFFVQVMDIDYGLRGFGELYFHRYSSVGAEHESFISGSQPYAISVSAFPDGVNLEFTGFPAISRGGAASPGRYDLAPGRSTLPVWDINNSIPLGPNPHRAILVRQD